MPAPLVYDRFLRIIHWLTAVTVLGLFAAGLWMVDLTYYSSWYKTAPHWHKSIGILLATVTVFRLVWKRLNTQPAIVGKQWEKLAAHAAHNLIYLLMFTLFFSGYLISTADDRPIDVFNWFSVPSLGELFTDQSDIAGLIHYYTALLLIALVVIHALAALKHHFVNKDDTLNKMLGGTNNE